MSIDTENFTVFGKVVDIVGAKIGLHRTKKRRHVNTKGVGFFTVDIDRIERIRRIVGGKCTTDSGVFVGLLYDIFRVGDEGIQVAG